MGRVAQPGKPSYRLDWRQDEHLKIDTGFRLVAVLTHDDEEGMRE